MNQHNCTHYNHLSVCLKCHIIINSTNFKRDKNLYYFDSILFFSYIIHDVNLVRFIREEMKLELNLK